MKGDDSVLVCGPNGRTDGEKRIVVLMTNGDVPIGRINKDGTQSETYDGL